MSFIAAKIINPIYEVVCCLRLDTCEVSLSTVADVIVGFGWWMRGESISSQRLQFELKLGRGRARLSELLDEPGPVQIAAFGAEIIGKTSRCLFKTLNTVACRCCFLLINLGTKCRSLVRTVVFYNALIWFFFFAYSRYI